ERSAQRNFGVKQAKGKYILYLDADMILSKNVVSECVKKCLSNNRLSALYIPEKIVNLSANDLLKKGSIQNTGNFGIKVRNFERSFYNATVIDCVRFVRRDAFLEINGFDQGLTGPEDWDFDRRIKATGGVNIISAPIFHNEGEFNLKNYLNKKKYYAQNFGQYIEKWGRKDSIIKKQFGLRYRYFGVFVEHGKWMRAIKHPILFLCLLKLRFLVGLGYLRKCKK
ncbi:MAG: glycosyltransferase family 2 protein, partial [Candidatus Omnitrophota bacterium]